MLREQTILCDVKVCKYHNQEGQCCNLPCITVTPTSDCATAHFCKEYERK